jgi:predicted RNase H-like HicB family nuclease
MIPHIGFVKILMWSIIYLLFRGVKLMKLKIILEPSEEAGYTAIVPALPGCISEGDTREEALRNIREAIDLYLEPVEDDLAPEANAELVELVV